MVGVIHGAVGALITQHIDSNGLAFAIGFASHFIVDMIPHGDRDAMFKWHHHGKIDTHWWVMGFDFIATTFFVATAFSLNTFENPYAAGYGFVGAILPDLIIGASELWKLLGGKTRILWRFYAFHFWFHNIFLRHNIDFSTRGGMMFQAIVLVGILGFVFI